MLRKFIFTLKEALRLLNKHSSKTIHYLGILVLNHLFTVFIFITCININYMQEVASTGSLPCIFNTLLEHNWVGINRIRIILFFCVLILGSFLLFINWRYIDYYIKHYSAEIRLVDKLNCSCFFIRWPMFYISFIQNGLALCISFGLGKWFYFLLYNFIHNTQGYQLVRFEFFDTSLFIFLLIVISGIVLVTDFYLFFKYSIK